MSTANIGYDSTSTTNALTITLASLPTSSTLVTGRASAAVDNTSTKYLDFQLFGQIMTGTGPSPNTSIELWGVAPLKIASGTKTYPLATTTALTASDEAPTFILEQKYKLALLDTIIVPATSDRAYSIFIGSIAEKFGGRCPMLWKVFVTQNTGQNLNATAGNHWLHWTGITETIA